MIVMTQWQGDPSDPNMSRVATRRSAPFENGQAGSEAQVGKVEEK